MKKDLSPISGLVQPIKTWDSLGIAWADLSKDWLPSDLQPPSLHTVYICLLLIQVQKEKELIIKLPLLPQSTLTL